MFAMSNANVNQRLKNSSRLQVHQKAVSLISLPRWMWVDRPRPDTCSYTVILQEIKSILKEIEKQKLRRALSITRYQSIFII